MLETKDSPSEKQWFPLPNCTSDLELWERRIMGVTFSSTWLLQHRTSVPLSSSAILTSSPFLFLGSQSRLDFLLPRWMSHYQMSERRGGWSQILCLVTLKARMVQRYIFISLCVTCQSSLCFLLKSWRFPFSHHTHVKYLLCGHCFPCLSAFMLYLFSKSALEYEKTL